MGSVSLDFFAQQKDNFFSPLFASHLNSSFCFEAKRERSYFTVFCLISFSILCFILLHIFFHLKDKINKYILTLVNFPLFRHRHRRPSGTSCYFFLKTNVCYFLEVLSKKDVPISFFFSVHYCFALLFDLFCSSIFCSACFASFCFRFVSSFLHLKSPGWKEFRFCFPLLEFNQKRKGVPYIRVLAAHSPL